METSFSRVIREHLALRERNADLDRTMPLEHYLPQGTTIDSAGLTESPLNVEDTAEIEVSRVTVPVGHGSRKLDSVDPSWVSPRSFDWGD